MIRRPRWMALLWLTVVTCRPQPVAVTPAPMAAPVPAPVPVEVEPLIGARAEGASVDEAYVEAKAGLATELLGSPAWATLVELEVHERGRDAWAVHQTHETQVVDIGLDHDRVAEMLVAFAQSVPHVDCPSPWREILQSWLAMHLRVVACERQRALLDLECETDDTSMVDSAFQQLTHGLRLAPGLRDGVPVGKNGPLRVPTVLALWHGAPLADVPLRVRGASGEAQRSRTDIVGKAILEHEGPWTVELDVDAMLGPMAAAWVDPPRATIITRLPTRRRWVAVMVDTPAASMLPLPDRQVSLPEPLRARLATPARQELLPTLADALSGSVDVILFVRARAAYAGKAGSGRVWFEAKVEAEAHDVWTGDALERFAITETGLGATDAEAREAALRKASEALFVAYETSKILPP